MSFFTDILVAIASFGIWAVSYSQYKLLRKLHDADIHPYLYAHLEIIKHVQREERWDVHFGIINDTKKFFYIKEVSISSTPEDPTKLLTTKVLPPGKIIHGNVRWRVKDSTLIEEGFWIKAQVIFEGREFELAGYWPGPRKFNTEMISFATLKPNSSAKF